MVFHFLVVGLCVSVLAGSSYGYHLNDPCDNLLCRAGRECRVLEHNKPSCHCVDTCPDHVSPVCGSNGRSYDNHCMLHRDACLSGKHISVAYKDYCVEEKKILEDRDRQKKKDKPVVCFQSERDDYHRHIVDYFLSHQADQDWYQEGMTYTETLWSRFYHCDDNKDTFLDSSELLECVRRNVTFSLRGDASSQLMRALCVDAIVDAGDKNSDWRLDFEEFKTCMDPTFIPEQKHCSLEGKHYEDGAETQVDCNDCVCACSNWVCVNSICEKTMEEKEMKKDEETEEDKDYDDDDDISEDDAELLTEKEWKQILKKVKQELKHLKNKKQEEI